MFGAHMSSVYYLIRSFNTDRQLDVRSVHSTIIQNPSQASIGSSLRLNKKSKLEYKEDRLI